MTPPYGGLGIWVWNASSNDPDKFCQRLAANHYSWVAVKAHDGGSAYNSAERLQAWKNACRKHRLSFGVWGYCSGDPNVDVSMAISSVHRWSPDFYIADVEIEYERAPAGSSRIFCERFRQALGHHYPRVISSFGRVDYHSGIDFKAWKEHGFDFMPQAYQNESLADAPSLCVDVAQRIWPRNRIFPTLATYKGARGTLTGQQLYDGVVRLALPGVNVWDSQELSGDQLEKLGTLHHSPRPPLPRPVVPVKHPQPKTPVWDKVHPHRPLKLTSPHTRGPDVQHLQQAINDRSIGTGTPPLGIDGQFGPATLHRTAVVAYALGLLDTTASIDTQRLVEYPWLRNPVQHRRGKQRLDAIAKAKQHAGQPGVAGIPRLAAHYIGIEENPHGSNSGHPFPSGWEQHFGMDGVSWCGCFAGSMILMAGGHVDSRVAYTPYIVADAHSRTNGFDRWVDNHGQAGPGWLVLYCWDGSGVADHVGIVESIHPDHLVAIEGNTGGSDPAAGGMVARVSRGYGPVLGYARPRL